MYQQQWAQNFSEERESQGVYLAFKRLIDVAFSSLVLIITAPILFVIALCVKLSSRGPILFKQTRVGKGGQPFTFYKFRTMYQNADPDVHRRHVKALIRNQ